MMGIGVVLSFTACNAHIKNATTSTARVYGNCQICESTIEEAGNVKGVARVDWDEDTKMALLTYDTHATNQDEILKRIALAGYDSDRFLAPDNVYAELPECCKYERVRKSELTEIEVMEDHSIHDHSETVDEWSETNQKVDQLSVIFDNYFSLKDVLVESDGSLASARAKQLLDALLIVEMNNLSNEEHMVWMQVMDDLIEDAQHMEETKDLAQQRNHFITLSDNMYRLLKVSNQDSPVHYQHCPMANEGKGANWLSKEKAIKNPFYGSAMLTCGKTVETID